MQEEGSKARALVLPKGTRLCFHCSTSHSDIGHKRLPMGAAKGHTHYTHTPVNSQSETTWVFQTDQEMSSYFSNEDRLMTKKHIKIKLQEAFSPGYDQGAQINSSSS